MPKSWYARQYSNLQPLGSKPNGVPTSWYLLVHYASELSGN